MEEKDKIDFVTHRVEEQKSEEENNKRVLRDTLELKTNGQDIVLEDSQSLLSI